MKAQGRIAPMAAYRSPGEPNRSIRVDWVSLVRESPAALDLSYVKADTPITLVRCYIPDGIDLTSSHLQSFEVRASVTVSISADMSELARDLVRFGTYGPLSLFRVTHRRHCLSHRRHITQQRPDDRQRRRIDDRRRTVVHHGFSTDGVVDLRMGFGEVAELPRGDLQWHGRDGPQRGAGRDRRDTLLGCHPEHVPYPNSIWRIRRPTRSGMMRRSWPAPGTSTIDGSSSNEFAGGPADAEARLRRARAAASRHRPQPYRQVATVLRASGREAGAADVLIAKENVLRHQAGLGRMERGLWGIACSR